MYFSIIQTNKLVISFKSTPWTPKPKIFRENHSLVKILLDSIGLRSFLDIAKMIATPTKAWCTVLKNHSKLVVGARICSHGMFSYPNLTVITISMVQ